eukprot:c23300_g1_i1 orf=420-2540(-)
MAQGGHQTVIGDYIVTQQIGSGSFAVVWKARHRTHGNEVAIKEIATQRLNKKLQDNLLSEIEILKKTNHPNIIRLHDIVEAPNRIYLVLEYCAGGDLAAYIQRYGRVSEAVARHFMCQLGSGLQVLRENNLIHRDLKPQNLLLSTNDSSAVLKIADFGFARSLQPQGLAETLCGSPLYMAPEILQFQKYDAKADLWSVGTILFQLVTGRPPFCGNSHVQLLQNIVKSNELRFPEAIYAELHSDCIDLCRKLLRPNPVERLSFEEFFNHSFLGQQLRQPSGFVVDSRSSGSNPFAIDSPKHSQEDCLPFILDEDPQVPSSSLSSSLKKHSISFIQSQPAPRGRVPIVASSEKGGTSMLQVTNSSGQTQGGKEVNACKDSISSKYIPQKVFESECAKSPASEKVVEQGPFHTSSSRGDLVDSLECIEREYVLVNVPLASTETISSSFNEQSTSKVCQASSKSPQKSSTPSIPVPILSCGGCPGAVGSLGSQGSVPSGTSQGSLDSAEVVDRPSIHPPTRLQSLQKCARVIGELVNDKLEAGQCLEAFSIQFVCLAIWKEALHICQRWADAVSGGSLYDKDEIGSMEAIVDNQGYKHSPLFLEGLDDLDQENAAAAACLHMEREFSSAVEHAEHILSNMGFLDGNAEMPDAMEIIFQSALSIGKNAAVRPSSLFLFCLVFQDPPTIWQHNVQKNGEGWAGRKVKHNMCA